MSFNTALSGLRAANTDLSVTGNNIANASTSGYKESRAEFVDVYANTLVGRGATSAGSGVLVTDIAQQFDQGNISFTDNSLDLAINGQGFFVLSDVGALSYTRSGNFGLDNDGYIVAKNGARLQGYPANSQGVISSGVLDDLQINTQDLQPVPTTSVDVDFNLDSRSQIPSVAFDPATPDSFNSSTSQTVYDSQGNPHVMTQYFVKTASNAWDMHIQIDEVAVGDGVNTTSTGAPGFQLAFQSDGALDTALSPAMPLSILNWDPVDPATGLDNGAATSTFAFDVSRASQFAGEFSVSNISQDGFAPGRLVGVDVDKSGILFARYTNGEALVLGQLALASFANQQGLTPLGSTAWGESFESGQPVLGSPESGSLGAVQSGALEESNVDLSEQLVRLIIAQRNFQANSKTIETNNTVTQTIINLR